jgi:hypothetical protein
MRVTSSSAPVISQLKESHVDPTADEQGNEGTVPTDVNTYGGCDRRNDTDGYRKKRGGTGTIVVPIGRSATYFSLCGER